MSLCKVGNPRRLILFLQKTMTWHLQNYMPLIAMSFCWRQKTLVGYTT